MEGKTTIYLPLSPERKLPPLLKLIVDALELYFIEQQQDIKAEEIRSIAVHFDNSERLIDEIFTALFDRLESCKCRNVPMEIEDIKIILEDVKRFYQ